MQLTFQSSWSPCIRSFGKCLKSINIQQNNWTYRTLLQHSRLSRHTPFRQVTRAEFQISEDTPFDANPLVIIVALLGWTLPASIPSNIPILHGTGLTQAFFFTSIQSNLAEWPKGPALDDFFGFIWFCGMWDFFIVLFFGTIGYGISKNRV
ncbi:Photosystem I subunit O [Galdieria sulphuraria]|nr:Photosystem I subunit O [Galdieria sulphuraria]